jgi:hypothetical protein
MSPSEYVTKIVCPNADEYLSDTGDLRRAVNACGAAYHIGDYVAHARGCSKSDVDRAIKQLCSPSWDVIEGVCNGSKHVRNTSHGDFKFTPGDERPIPVFAFDVPGSGWNQARWEIPGLEVDHQGNRLFIDFCLRTVLGAFGRAFPAEFSGVDLESYGQKVPGWPSAP